MDFIPAFNITKRKTNRSATSKLSLKSRRQFSQSQSQSCSQVDPELFKNERDRFSFSQPVPDNTLPLKSQAENNETKTSESSVSVNHSIDDNSKDSADDNNTQDSTETLLAPEVDVETISTISIESQISKDLKDLDTCTNEEIITIDLVSTPEEDEPVELEKENVKKKTGFLKPSLDKIKQLQTSSDEKCNDVTEQNEKKKSIKNIGPIEAAKSTNDDKIKKRLNEAEKSPIKRKPKAKYKKNVKSGSSDTNSSTEEETEMVSLEGKTRFASKLQVFGKQEPKKFTFHQPSGKSSDLASVENSIPCEEPPEKLDIASTSDKDEVTLNEPKTVRKQNDSPIVKYPAQSPQSKASHDTAKAQNDLSSDRKSTRVEEAMETSPRRDINSEAGPVAGSSEGSTSEELPCPLCNKQTGKNRRAHMKSCAAKNNVTTAQLLRVIELQEKQAAERRALGLPAIVPNPNQRVLIKKKVGVRGSSKDASLELAMALSKSLLEAQEHEELLETRRLLGEQDAFEWQSASQLERPEDKPAQPEPATTKRSTVTVGGQLVLGPGSSGTVQLQRSGNTARKGRGPRTLANAAPSLLLTTTQEERNRRITDKVAMLLVGDDEQTAEAKVKTGETAPGPSHPLSSKLRKKQSEGAQLWHMSAVSPSTERSTFYVSQLSEFISPTKHEAGTNLRRLSQIPGRLNSPVREAGHDTLLDVALCSFVDSAACQSEPQACSSRSSSNKPSTSGGSAKANSVSAARQERSSSHFSANSPSTSRHHTKEAPVHATRQGGAGLGRDWAALLNSRTMSDVTVYVNGELELRAHKLVLFARCPAMLEDLALEMTPKGKGVQEQMLLWGEISRDAALAMLEFLYCDTTTRATTLGQEHLEELMELARRYEVKELLQHLLMLSKIRSNLVSTIESPSKSRSNAMKTNEEPSRSPNLGKIRSLIPESKSSYSPIKFKSKLSMISEIKTPEKSIASPSSANYSPKSNKSIFSQRTKSPDLFDEEVKSPQENDSRPDIAYLVSMMEKSMSQKLPVKNPSDPAISPRTLTPPNVNKRKYSPSLSSSKSSLKKQCKDLSNCRKRLLSELDDVSSLRETDKSESSTENVKSMSSSQLLDMLENSPTGNNNSKKPQDDIETSRNYDYTDTGSPIISDVWDNFEDVGCMPVTPGIYHSKSPDKKSIKSPNTIITISSGTVSQTSKVSSVISQANSLSSQMDKTVINTLDDSLAMFMDADLSGIEKAALNAYNKVVSPPLQSCTPQMRPGTSRGDVTPLADYSVMESPALQKELDKYGIRRLRRNQAKLILRHIYNELHPLVPATPVPGPSKVRQSPVKNKAREGSRPTRIRGRRGASSGLSRADVQASRATHNISLSQPNPAQDDSFEDLMQAGPSGVHNISLSQPVNMRDDDEEEESSESRDSSSSDEDRDSSSEFDDPELVAGSASQVLETQVDVRAAMSRLIAADPALHHRLLMYEPVQLEELQGLLRQHGVKCHSRVLLDYLDEHCITFRVPRPPRAARGTQRRKRSPRKGGTTSQRGTRGRRKKVVTDAR